MADGYVRQSATEIQDDEVILAADLNAEFDAIQSAFDETTGHNHDGTVGGGAPIPFSSLDSIPNTVSTLGTLTGTNGSFVRFTGPSTAVMQDIVGTVSQSGGIPTGAIIERGSNANGEYIRWADGTQICTRLVSGLGPINTASGNVFISGVISGFTYPASFSGVAAASILTGNESNLNSWVAGISQNAFSSNFPSFYMFRATSNANTDFTARFIAIGRWF